MGRDPVRSARAWGARLRLAMREARRFVIGGSKASMVVLEQRDLPPPQPEHPSFRVLSAAAVAVSIVLLLSGCGRPAGTVPKRAAPPGTLSSWGLFSGELALQVPAPGVEPYEINTPAFENHAASLRFVRLPNGEVARHRDDDVPEFPVGTVLAQTLYYPRDAGQPDGSRRLVETRILVREAEEWVALPYIWNEEQSEAVLEIVGGTVEVTWIDGAGGKSEERRQSHRVPDVNQCKRCHRVRQFQVQPIGLRAGQLNREIDHGGGSENQLVRWLRLGLLVDLPPLEAVPRYPVWHDEASGSLDDRARVWLEINCAHCHNPGGTANMSGLDLRYSQSDPTRRGIRKAPVAAGQGTGGRHHDIVPGQPDASIVVYRLESLEPGHMMPEIGRFVVDHEGVALIRRWIAEMDDPLAARSPADP